MEDGDSIHQDQGEYICEWSDATKTFKRGMDAHNNPSFYRQLGKQPDELISNALELLAKKFSL
jgi:hypothetical protein